MDVNELLMTAARAVAVYVLLIQGTVGIVVIASLAFADSLLCYWDRGLEAVLEGKLTLVVKQGRFHRVDTAPHPG